MYPDYCYPSRGQKRKGRTSGKDDASAPPSEPAPKRKKVKVLTHRPRYIESAIVPEYGGETSSAAEAKESVPMQKIKELAATPKTPLAKLGEPKVDNVKETEVERTKILEVTSPSAEVIVSKAQKDLTVTPKRKRMVHVLDVLEEIKTSSSTPGKTAEASKTRIETKQTEAEAAKSHAKTEARPSEPVKEKSPGARGEEVEKGAVKQILLERTVSSTPEASSEVPDYIVRHASRKRLSEEEKREAQYYAQKLKYPKGGTNIQRQRRRRFLVLSPRQQGNFCLPGDGKKLRIPNARRWAFGAVER
jgi:hypothetical protein